LPEPGIAYAEISLFKYNLSVKNPYQLNNYGDNSECTMGAREFFFCFGPSDSYVRKALLPPIIIELLP